MICATSTMRSSPSPRTRISSPTCTGLAGLAWSPLMRTCPARHAAAAAARVRVNRTTQTQRSTRVVKGLPLLLTTRA